MFGATIWVLFSLRSVDHVNRPMLVVACLLLFFSTVVRVSFWCIDQTRTS